MYLIHSHHAYILYYNIISCILLNANRRFPIFSLGIRYTYYIMPKISKSINPCHYSTEYIYIQMIHRIRYTVYIQAFIFINRKNIGDRPESAPMRTHIFTQYTPYDILLYANIKQILSLYIVIISIIIIIYTFVVYSHACVQYSL